MTTLIKTEDICKHPTICKTLLMIKPLGSKAFSVHEVELKVAEDELNTEYFVFTVISGQSVMNWNLDEYRIAQNYLDIGETPIFVVTSQGDEPVPVPDSYRK